MPLYLEIGGTPDKGAKPGIADQQSSVGNTTTDAPIVRDGSAVPENTRPAHWDSILGDAPTQLSTEEEFADFYENETPEGLALEQVKQDMDDADEARVVETADALYKNVGLAGEAPSDEAYDYQQMVREGGSITPEGEEGDQGFTLPNRFIKRSTVELSGYDLATNEKVRQGLPDPDGLVAEGVAELHSSKFNTVDGHPIEDTASLSKIGVEHIRNGGDYEGFKSSMPSTFTDEQASMAYRVAGDYVKKGELMEFLKDDTIPAPDEAPLPSWDLTDDGLSDPETTEGDLWLRSARELYRNMDGEEFTGTNEELHELALETMALFNWSPTQMGVYTYQVMNGPDSFKRAFYTMIKLYDNKDTTASDVVNNLMSLGADPTSYMSLGFGSLGARGAMAVAKKALSDRLLMFIGAASAGAGEGAVYMGLDDFARQMVDVEASAKKEYNASQTAGAVATGAAAGAVMGPAMVYGGEKLLKYGKDLGGRITEMRRSPDRSSGGPISRQRGTAGFKDPVNAEDMQGLALSNIGSIDQSPPPFKPKTGQAKSPGKQVGEYLHAKSLDALGGEPILTNTPENRKTIVNTMVREAEAQIMKDKEHGFKNNAGEWYRKTLGEARGIASKTYPEISTDVAHRNAFDFGLAVTSNGQSVDENWQYAMRVYEYWRKEGKMPTTKDYGNGKEVGAMMKSFNMYNELEKAWGAEVLNKNMATEFTVGDLRKAGFDISDELITSKLPMSVIFGSKIGGGFFSNLQGDWTRLTPDRWFARTWGRYTGTMMESTSTPKAIGHRASFRKNYSKHRKLIQSYLGKDIPTKAQLTDEMIDDMGMIIYKKWAGLKHPDKKNPIHTLSRAIDKRLSPREGPQNGSERQMMRETVEEAVHALQERGHSDLTISGLQAILWYPEQRYWDQLGSSQKNIENNYAKAAAKHAGLPVDSVGEGRTRSASEEGARPSLDSREAEQFLTTEVARNLRVGPRGAAAKTPPGRVFRGSAGSTGNVSVGGSTAVVAKTHEVRGNLQNLGKDAAGKKIKDPTQNPLPAMQAANITDEPWQELELGSASDLAFNKAITAATAKMAKDKVKGKLTQAVYIYDAAGEDSLELATKFLSEDGLSGFAIKNNGDIVSAFNASDRPNSGLSALMLAVEMGGRKLDAFDTGLGDLYARAGFVVDYRVKWSDADMFEEGMSDAAKNKKWDKSFWKRFAPRGEPDIIYMKYEPQSSGYYEKGSGEYKK